MQLFRMEISLAWKTIVLRLLLNDVMRLGYN